jgi:hypothetical protein
MFKLEVLPAGKGDCLMLHYGSEEDPRIALIDGGPGGVYRDHLRPRLIELRDERGLGPNDTLALDLMMVSHIDDDHINGILALARELDDDRREGKPPFVAPDRFWHNSFDSLIGNNEVETQAALTAQFGAASVSADLLPDDAGLSDDAVMVLASVSQGHELRGLAVALNWPVNPDFGGKIAWVGAGPAPVRQLENLTLKLIGPLKAEVLSLQASYDKWLADQAKKKSAAASLIAAFKDKSVPNLSSIVVIAEAEGRSMLLTGDARGDKILEGLELTGELEPGGKRHFDILKGPHHGSIHNVDRIFFERLTADTYVFSANGEHGNPDRETLEMLFDVRPEGGYKVVLTYPLAHIDAEHAKEMASSRKTFDPDKHGIATLLEGPLPPDVELVILDGAPMQF